MKEADNAKLNQLAGLVVSAGQKRDVTAAFERRQPAARVLVAAQDFCFSLPADLVFISPKLYFGGTETEVEGFAGFAVRAGVWSQDAGLLHRSQWANFGRNRCANWFEPEVADERQSHKKSKSGLLGPAFDCSG